MLVRHHLDSTISADSISPLAGGGRAGCPGVDGGHCRRDLLPHQLQRRAHATQDAGEASQAHAQPAFQLCRWGLVPGGDLCLRGGCVSRLALQPLPAELLPLHDQSVWASGCCFLLPPQHHSLPVSGKGVGWLLCTLLSSVPQAGSRSDSSKRCRTGFRWSHDEKLSSCRLLSALALAHSRGMHCSNRTHEGTNHLAQPPTDMITSKICSLWPACSLSGFK